MIEPVIIDLVVDRAGSGGAVWNLPHGGDLDANLIRLDPGSGIGEHTNGEVDVLVLARSGAAVVAIDGFEHPVGAHHLILIPRGSTRSIASGPSGFEYLSVHLRRGPLSIGDAPKRPD